MYVYCIKEVAFGRGRHFDQGDVFFADDPLVLAHPGLFSTTPPSVKRTQGFVSSHEQKKPVEQASAAPGEKRAVKRGG